jgi:radical SAM superfamily enzyme YgiQ (UPF0313 family)
LIRDAHRIDPAHRPLIIAGGPHAVYEPYDLFSANPARPGSADVVVTGEEFVLLSLIEVVLSTRVRGESMRSAFVRARDNRALHDVPGLVYARGGNNGVPEELVDTGIQRLVGDLDELPHPVLGYRLMEPPGPHATLSTRAMPIDQVQQRSPISSLVLTFGCKFACPYCPIPAYNQRQYRMKSGERIADEMWRLNQDYGLCHFLGTDDNFFNDKARALDIVDKLAGAQFDGVRLNKQARWYTEVTVHDTLKMKEHLPLIRESGCRALWLGVEDLTATLVKKGQSADKTTEAFRALRDADDDASRHPTALLARVELRVTESDRVAAKGRRRLDADSDAHPRGGFEAARVDLHERPGVQERRPQSGAPAHVRRQLRGCVQSQKALAKAVDHACGLFVLLQPGLAHRRADP